MKALITGGAGFIGSRLAIYLLNNNWDVTLVDNLSSGKKTNIPKEANFIWCDLTHSDFENLLPNEHFDRVFHLASQVGQAPSFNRPVFDMEINGIATLKMLQWAHKKKVGQFLFASSVNVYGEPKSLPIYEDDPLSAPSFYAVGKLSSEYYCKIFQGLGLNTTIFRLFNIYGPHQDMDNLSQGMLSIYLAYIIKNTPISVKGSLERKRDFVYVDDLAEAFFKAANSSKAFGEIYNIATESPITVANLLKLLAQIWRKDNAEYPIDQQSGTINDQQIIYGSYKKIKEHLDWEPKTNISDGVQKMVNWLKNV